MNRDKLTTPIATVSRQMCAIDRAVNRSLNAVTGYDTEL